MWKRWSGLSQTGGCSVADRSACTILIPKVFYEAHQDSIKEALEGAALGESIDDEDIDIDGLTRRYVNIITPDCVGGGEDDVENLLRAPWANRPDCVLVHEGQCHYAYPGYTRIWWSGRWFYSGLLGSKGDPVPLPVITYPTTGVFDGGELACVKEYLRARQAFLDACTGTGEVEPNPNVNCLAGMKCPRCGSFGPFRIATMAETLMGDNGTEDEHGAEFDDHSFCGCTDCAFEGQVRDFWDPLTEPLLVTFSDTDQQVFESLGAAEKAIHQYHQNERIFPDEIVGKNSGTKYVAKWRVQIDKE